MQEIPELITARDLIRYAASEFNRNQLFFGHGTSNALDEALALVLHALSLDYGTPDHYLDCRLTQKEKQDILKLLDERIETRQPLSYLTGKAYFAGLEFIVNNKVLVPRSPIAELIESHFYPWVEPDNVTTILDLCTGSGCIGIASAIHMPNTRVTLSDISDEALAIAQQNINHHELQDRVSAIKSNVFENLQNQQFDLIVSNPPYVSTDEYQSLPAEYHQEPQLGLEAGEDGMDIVAMILAEAENYLTEQGVLIVEVGASADLLMQRYPNVLFNWIDFEHGGDGVFVMTRDELSGIS